MLKNYFTIFMTLLCLMHLCPSNAQVYAPDTTFKLNFDLGSGTKINFLHKIDENSYYVGTNISVDFGKPFIRNLYKVNTDGKPLNTFKEINATLIDANGDRILLTTIEGTFIFEDNRLKFIDKRKAFDIYWESENILVSEVDKVRIMDLKGNQTHNLQNFPYYTGYYGSSLVIFQNINSIAAYYNDRILHFDLNGREITPPFLAYIPNTGIQINSILFERINNRYLGINKFEHGFEFPNNAHTLTLIDSVGKFKPVGRQKIIGKEGSNIILRTNECSSKYNIVNKNFERLEGRTLLSENLKSIISFNNFFIATDGTSLFKLSTKNSKYIEAQLPDTLEINSKPFKITTKTIGSNEKINISSNFDLVRNDTLFPKKAGNFVINFKTNSGLFLCKTITIKKRSDSISFTGFRDFYLSELPLKFSVKSQSGLPVKYNLEYDNLLFLKNDEIINRRLPFSTKQKQYSIYLQTTGNEEYERSIRKLTFEIKDLREIIDFENQDSKFVLFPNPVTDNSLKVLYTGAEAISNPDFTLYNITGKAFAVLVRNDSNDYIYHLSFPKLQSGVYFLQSVFYSFKLDTLVQEIKRFIVK